MSKTKKQQGPTLVYARLLPAELAVVDDVAKAIARGQQRRSEAVLFLLKAGWEAVKNEPFYSNPPAMKLQEETCQSP